MLVADDQPDVIAALRLLLRTAGFDALGAASVEDVRAHLAAHDVDAVLMDLNYARDTTSGVEGLDLISDLHATQPHLPLIAMTGWANVETAVEAMRRGARGYIPKPWNNDALVQVLRAEIERARRGATHPRGARTPREWREAEAIHRALLPSVLPEVPGCRLAWRWEPASGFGGDYYDAILLGPDRLAICIADVCGKGLPRRCSCRACRPRCAHSSSRTPPRTTPWPASTGRSAGRARTAASSRCSWRCSTLPTGIRYCNAGHNPPILVRSGGAVSRLDAGGAIVGVFDAALYDSGRA